MLLRIYALAVCFLRGHAWPLAPADQCTATQIKFTWRCERCSDASITAAIARHDHSPAQVETRGLFMRGERPEKLEKPLVFRVSLFTAALDALNTPQASPGRQD